MKRAIVISLSAIMLLMGCATSQSMEARTYQMLYTGQTVYETTMEIVADLQKQGFISPEHRREINKHGDAYVDAHLAAAKALYAYHMLEGEAEEKDLLHQLQTVQLLYSEFLAFVRPLILAHMED